MRVETVMANGAGSWSLGVVGQTSEQFRRVTLTAAQLATLTIRDLTPAYRKWIGRLLNAVAAHNGRRPLQPKPMPSLVQAAARLLLEQ